MDIVLGLLLTAVGAILAFAVRIEPAGLDLDAVGWILMVAGAGIVLLGLVWRDRQRSLTRVVEHRTYPPPVVEHRVYPPPVGRVVERKVYLPDNRYYDHAVPSYPGERPGERSVERAVGRVEERIVEQELIPPAVYVTEEMVYRDPPP